MTTERDILDALWARLTRHVNGLTPRYVMAEHVRLDPTYGHRIADAIAVDTWGSGDYRLEGYEVKTSRSDWRRELADDAAKSAPWRAHCSRWWIVAPADVVPTAELPEGWGLISYRPTSISNTVLRVERRSAIFPTTPMPARTVASLMRAVHQTTLHHAAARGTIAREEAL